MKKKDLLKLNILLLSGLLLTSCNIKNQNTGLYYTKKEQEKNEIDGTIPYNKMKNYKFIVLYNYNSNKEEYYISSKNTIRGMNNSKYVYNDIFTGQEIFKEETELIEPTENKIKTNDIYKVYEESLEKYLINNNIIQKNYSIDDTKSILENLTKDYQNLSNPKTLKLKKD